MSTVFLSDRMYVIRNSLSLKLSVLLIDTFQRITSSIKSDVYEHKTATSSLFGPYSYNKCFRYLT